MTKSKQLLSSLMLSFCICIASAFGQSIDEKDIIGNWEIQGTLMGEDGSGALLPHKNVSPDCKDYSVFLDDYSGKDVRHKQDCEAREQEFSWEINDDVLTLSRGERSIKWHIASIEENTMTVGVQLKPDSENRMYVQYKKVGESAKSKKQ
ncbi:lipocalin family protein [Algoriphagus sp. NG3]|uniref:lipocalin family protein n=1 Tax=Algoriphagus sp. NG3 TaxID=3097546 RepID=UPI002A7EABD5|nr:lipocalin family protein [Algoriphagus sp. NG3]WPR75425.1 lipocalin family protein [Algoriphagus sp. NG3]